MYNSRLSWLLLAVCFFAAAVNSQKCYDPINNGALGTTFMVQGNYFPSPYACSLSATNVALAAPSTYTFNAGGEGTLCGEIVSAKEVSYGYYECEMVPPGVAGTVTTCMVASTTKANFEAVYIKFFGNETERVYTGYFSGGRSNPTGPVTLGFDATNKAHKYGFEWTSGYIRWYVDGKEVTSALGGKALPNTPNRFYASLLTESKGVNTDDTILPTDTLIDRNFDPLTTASAVFTNISYTPVIFVACDNTTGILPGDNGWKPYDPSECDKRERIVIFDDALAAGWTSTDSTASTFGDTTGPFRTGTKSISWFFTPTTARLYFIYANTFSTANYDNFEFWINGNGYFGQQVGIKVLFDDGSVSLEIKINDVLDEGVLPYTWSRAVVPFSLFGITSSSPRALKGFVLSSTSNEYGGRIVIDDVALGFTLPICSGKTKNVYSEGLAKGYTDEMSWGKGINIKSNKLAHTSSYAIQWDMYENSGLRINSKTSVNTKDYQGVAFWINPSELQGQDWTVSVTSPDSTGENQVAGLEINLYKYYGGPLPQQSDQWTRIVLPFYTFGIVDTKTKINGVLFKMTNNRYQGSLYIDDIDFVAPGSDQGGNAASIGVGMLGLVLVVFSLLM